MPILILIVISILWIYIASKGSTKKETYKLSYFPIRGRAEMSRYIFAVDGTAYTDDRIQNWNDFKKETPFGKLPILTLKDGTIISQSRSIERYLARIFGLLGAGETEAALVDAMCEQVRDVDDLVMDLFREEKDETKLASFWSTDLPVLLAYFEKAYEASGTHYVVGKKLTLADLYLFHLLVASAGGPFDEHGEKLAKALESFKRLSAGLAATAKNQNLQKWIKERPSSKI